MALLKMWRQQYEKEEQHLISISPNSSVTMALGLIRAAQARIQLAGASLAAGHPRDEEELQRQLKLARQESAAAKSILTLHNDSDAALDIFA